MYAYKKGHVYCIKRKQQLGYLEEMQSEWMICLKKRRRLLT